MRILSRGIGITLITVFLSCVRGPVHNDNLTIYPLSAGVKFNISAVNEDRHDRTLFVIAKEFYPSTGYRLNSSDFNVAPNDRRIELHLDGAIGLGGGYDVFQQPSNSWSLPDLPPGAYQFDLLLDYPEIGVVHDIYSVTIIDADSIVVIPIRADSSEFISF